ncbi:substrate-binding domain-containing protein [Butyrivibrio sp. MC2013]|uniref:substrate-binding domain-containing protein n=1 Tax=Butyrivibrio sp. MC2013 TaxID=1280686 RepID=UPI0004025520|nr:GGDEF domain-containing protein [Butyrivibrio sp. MC2013]
MKRIGIMIANISSVYAMDLLASIFDHAGKKGVQVFVFAGTHTNGFLRSLNDSAIKYTNYNYQCNVVYDYYKFCNLDAIIVSAGTFSGFLYGKTLTQFLESFGDIPIVVTEQENDVSKYSIVRTDNYASQYQLCEHLIRERGCKKILILAGPENNDDAIERLTAIKDCIRDNGLEFTDEMLEYGDFSPGVQEQATRLLAHNMDADAVMCGNDLMAEAVYKVCSNIGLKVGKDIIVTGFDDAAVCTQLSPTLTTVGQDIDKIAETALDLAIELIGGGEHRALKIPSKVILRGSSSRLECFDPEFFTNSLQAANDKYDLLLKQVFLISNISHDMLLNVDDERAFYASAAEKLVSLGCNYAWMMLMEEPKAREATEVWECPDELYMVIKIEDSIPEVFCKHDDIRINQEIGIGHFRNAAEDTLFDTSGGKTLFPIFSGAMQYGLLMVDSNADMMYPIQLAISQIATAMTYYTQHNEIVEHSVQLEGDSMTDDLTQMLNTRGISQAMERYASFMADSEPSMRLLVVELNNLKEIRDKKGHDEGDVAILTMAEALSSVFMGDHYMVAHVGDDEFAIIVMDSYYESPEEERERLEDYCDTLNQDIFREYYIEPVIGYLDFVLREDTKVEDLIKEAEMTLAEDRKNRRNSAMKEF